MLPSAELRLEARFSATAQPFHCAPSIFHEYLQAQIPELVSLLRDNHHGRYYSLPLRCTKSHPFKVDGLPVSSLMRDITSNFTVQIQSSDPHNVYAIPRDGSALRERVALPRQGRGELTGYNDPADGS